MHIIIQDLTKVGEFVNEDNKLSSRLPHIDIDYYIHRVKSMSQGIDYRYSPLDYLIGSTA